MILRRRMMAVGVAALLTVSPAVAQWEEEEEKPRKQRADNGLLDEYNVDVFYAGKDVAHVAAGLTFGDVFRSGLYWSRGARVSWLQAPSPSGELNGWALGGVLTVGLSPERWVSPFASIALDRPFHVHGRYGLESTIGAGARVRVSPRLPEHYAVSFAVIQNDLFGKGGAPDRTDYGVAIFYATSVLIRK